MDEYTPDAPTPGVQPILATPATPPAAADDAAAPSSEDDGLPTLPAGWVIRVVDVRRERGSLRGIVAISHRSTLDGTEQLLHTHRMPLGSDRERKAATKAAAEALRATSDITTSVNDITRLRTYLAAVHASEERAAAEQVTTRAAGPRYVRDALPTAPVPAEALIPSRWELSDAATIYAEKPEPLAAPAPVVISAILADIDGGALALDIAWARRGVWRHLIVDRGDAADARKIVAHAGQGLPITSPRAPAMVAYLAAFESLNWAILPRRRVATHLGWLGPDGRDGFLLGRTLILPDGHTTAEITGAEDTPETWHEDWVAHRALSPGDAQIADAYHTRGSMSEWLRAVSVLQDYPHALLDLYASFAAPLLQILDAPNFVLDHAYRTSTGKTTVLRVAASVWGCPDESAQDSAITSWDATKVYIERAAYALAGIPLLLDDSKRVKVPAMVGDVIYLVANGRGRGRGSIRGMAETRSWRTVLLSTGEAPAASFTADGGARQRCIEIMTPPFGDPSIQSAMLVSTLRIGIFANYGHAGRAYVQYLLRHRADWPKWRDEYARDVARLIDAARTPEATRLAQYGATIAMAAALAHAALELPWPLADPLAGVWVGIAEAAAEAPPEVRALPDVLAWTTAHAEAFEGHHRTHDGEPIPPASGWAGTWHSTPSYLPTLLRQVLRDLNYDPEAILPAWAERGWLARECEHLAVQRRMWGQRQRMYALTPAALEAAGWKVPGEPGTGAAPGTDAGGGA